MPDTSLRGLNTRTALSVRKSGPFPVKGNIVIMLKLLLRRFRLDNFYLGLTILEPYFRGIFLIHNHF